MTASSKTQNLKKGESVESVNDFSTVSVPVEETSFASTIDMKISSFLLSLLRVQSNGTYTFTLRTQNDLQRSGKYNKRYVSPLQ